MPYSPLASGISQGFLDFIAQDQQRQVVQANLKNQLLQQQMEQQKMDMLKQQFDQQQQAQKNAQLAQSMGWAGMGGGAPQAPAPGQASVPMQMPAPPSANIAAPSLTQQAINQAIGTPPAQQKGGFAPVPRLPVGQPMPTGQAQLPAPPIQSQAQGRITLEGAIAKINQQYPDAPDSLKMQALEGIVPYLNSQDKAELAALRAQVSAKREAEQERHNRAVESGGVSGGAIPQSTVDFYAQQSLSGDNSWQVGLARGKVGQKLIAAVKDRIPQLAAEQSLTPQDVSSAKATRDSLSKSLADRQKFVATGQQFVANFQKQADLVEKYLKPGVAGQSPAINRWIQAGRKSVAGDPDVTALDTAIRGLAREHQRIVTGITSNAQLHVAAQETADQLLNTSMNEQQIRANLKVMREEAQNAIDSGNQEVDFLKTQLKHIGTGQPAAQPSVTTSQDEEAIAWAKANPADPRSKKILQLHNM